MIGAASYRSSKEDGADRLHGENSPHNLPPPRRAILLNEVRKAYLSRTIKTLVYLPHFLSW
jgi:hypothetical protein